MIRPFEALVGTNLNSIWLEGRPLSPPVPCPGPGTRRFRLEADNPAGDGPASVFLVEAADRAFEGVLDGPRPGGRLRIIGRLADHRWRDAEGRPQRGVKIVGELVEWCGVPP